LVWLGNVGVLGLTKFPGFPYVIWILAELLKSSSDCGIFSINCLSQMIDYPAWKLVTESDGPEKENLRNLNRMMMSRKKKSKKSAKSKK